MLAWYLGERRRAIRTKGLVQNREVFEGRGPTLRDRRGRREMMRVKRVDGSGSRFWVSSSRTPWATPGHSSSESVLPAPLLHRRKFLTAPIAHRAVSGVEVRCWVRTFSLSAFVALREEGGGTRTGGAGHRIHPSPIISRTCSRIRSALTLRHSGLGGLLVWMPEPEPHAGQ